MSFGDAIRIVLVVLALALVSCSEDSTPLAPANRPPVVPHSPEPADSTEYSGEILVVSWLGGDPDGDIVTYTVEVQEGDAVFAVGQTGYTTMDTGFFLERSTTYNWRVIATDDIDVTEGPWWTISTPEWTNEPPYPPSTPSPSDGNTGVQTINLNLTWSADDPDATLMAFLESTYQAVADLARWDRAALEVPAGYPRESA